ncbi:MAG TPA: hypothetical protein VEZ16_00310 [Microvirga sp.]|nr:hypothetical protein [Microvirga sp.]
MVDFKVERLDAAERAAEKQASREHDLARLNSGEVSRAQLRAENGFFSSLRLSELRIVAIGGKPLSEMR